jgi:hypothetical protein
VSAAWSGREIVRQVVELGFLASDGEPTTLASRAADGFQLQPAGTAALARWTGLSANVVECAIVERAQQLAARHTPR